VPLRFAADQVMRNPHSANPTETPRSTMAKHCTFVPPHILNHIAREHARETGDPTEAQRSAVVSAEFRRRRRYRSPGLLEATAVAAAAAPPAHVGAALTVPVPGTAGRLIYDDQNQWVENVELVRGEGDAAVGGQNANRAYDGLGAVHDFYQKQLGRNSIDNAGLNLVGNVNFGEGFDNAFWDPDTLVMVFGNGSGVVFQDMTLDIDVLGHELTHGVTQFSAGLTYTDDQTGALNESFSDMLGSAINAAVAGRDADTHDWLIGNGIMAPGLAGEALRSMAEPGTAYDNPIMGRDPQPRDMSGYFEPADPHLMSGITNRWFYLICKEIGIGAGALIMYQTLQNLWPSAVFNDAAVVATAQARILAAAGQAPAGSAQVVRAAARQQGFW
jgi:Zn-dependent metalloprotease